MFRQPLSEEVSEKDKKILEQIEASIKTLPPFDPNSRKKVSENKFRNYILKNIFYDKYSKLECEDIKKSALNKIESYMVEVERYDEEGYNLVMISELPNNDKRQAEFGTIYISTTGEYIVRDYKGVIQEGKIDTTILDIANLEQKINQPDFKFSLLQQTSLQCHTQLEIPYSKGIYTWFLENKMSFCNTKREEYETYEKILSTYQSIFEEYPKFASWLIVINYLNFLSRNDHEECRKLCNEFLQNKDTFIIKPTNRDLAKIWNILAIEYQKEGEFKKSLECIKKGKKLDEKYAPLFATEGHLYEALGQDFGQRKNNEKAQQYYKKRTESFNKAMNLNRDRFNKKHPETKTSQSKVTSLPINQSSSAINTFVNHQLNITMTTSTTSVKQPSIKTTTTTTTPVKQPNITTTTTTATSHDKEASRKTFNNDPVLMSNLRGEDFLKIYVSTKGEEKLIFRKIYISPKGKYIFHDSKRNVYEGEIDSETLKKIDQPDFRSSLLKQISRTHTPISQGESKKDVTGLNSEAKPRAQNGLSAKASTFTPRTQNGLSANASTFTPRAQNGLTANAGIFTPGVLSANASVVTQEPKESEANDQTRQQGNLKKK